MASESLAAEVVLDAGACFGNPLLEVMVSRWRQGWTLAGLGGVAMHVLKQDKVMAFQISTHAFGDGASIPLKYTCSGADVSPALSWSEPPEGTKSLALMVEDPDAPGGTWYHWLVWNIPGHSGGLWEHVAPTGRLPGGMMQGGNSFGRMGYGGPCPPPGQTHRYIFKLYALDSMLDLPAGANHLQLEHAMRGHVQDETEWIGRYGR